LTNDPRPPGSQCATQGELFTARGGAGQQQVRQIHADDEQYQAHRAPQHDQRAAQFSADVVLQLGHGSRVIVIPVLVCGSDLRHQNIHFRLRLGHGQAGLETAHKSQRVPIIAQHIHYAGT
jgi:hypothetical protein